MLAALFVCSFGRCCSEADRRQSACASILDFALESWEEHGDGYFRAGEAEKQRARGTGDLEQIWDLQALCSELTTNFHLPPSFQPHPPEILGSESPGGQCPAPGFAVSSHGVMVVVISTLLLP